MMQAPHSKPDGEIDALLHGIHDRYGYDFSHYARASLHRRIERAREKARVADYTALLKLLSQDAFEFDRFLRTISISVTDMFRDPPFYRMVREMIVPMLKTFPFVKIWHAGCATGEEAYSMAMVLHEEGLLDRARIYATDFNTLSLERADNGVFPVRKLFGRAAQYRQAGGRGDFFNYFTVGYDFARIKDFLKNRITFSYHNLVTDGVFGEMNLICCRNVLIYFDRVLQEQVLRQFADSLRHGGYLCLGAKENIGIAPLRGLFTLVDDRQKAFRKTGPIAGQS